MKSLNKPFAAATVTAAALMLALVPFNMGGCSDTVSSLASSASIGGSGSSNKTAGLFATGAKAFEALNLDAQQRTLGQSTAISITNTYPLADDQRLQDYVTLVGLTVAMSSDRPDIVWYFGVLNSSEPNAYSTPGGYVFITRGAIDQMQDEAELAGLLAHEISHVIHEDAMGSLRRSKWTDVATTAVNTQTNVGQFAQATDVLADITLKKAGDQEQERSADTTAVSILVDAGYDPSSYMHLLQRMQQIKGTKQGLENVLSTHPPTKERVSRVSAAIQKLNATGGQTNKDRFEENTPKPRQ